MVDSRVLLGLGTVHETTGTNSVIFSSRHWRSILADRGVVGYAVALSW